MIRADERDMGDFAEIGSPIFDGDWMTQRNSGGKASHERKTDDGKGNLDQGAAETLSIALVGSRSLF
jgi:hypothetical protein